MTSVTARDPALPSRLLHDRGFRAILGARLTNALATTGLATVVAFQTYQITGDPLALGWLGLVEAIPALSLVLFGGQVADRHERRAIVIVTSTMATLCATTFAVLSGAGALSLAGILAVIFVTGLASGFERPALTAFQAQIVPREEAARGISWMSGMEEAGSIAGPTLSGLAIAILGIPATYGAIAVLLLASTVFLLLTPHLPMPPLVPGAPFRDGLLKGLRYVVRSRALLGSMALDLFAVLFGGAIALLPIFADRLGVGAVGLGLMRTAPSLGALTVMAVATRRPPGRRAGRTLLVCVAGFGLSMVVFGLSTVFVLSLAALVISGLTDGVSMIIRQTIVRVLSPEAIRGRVASVNWIFIGASNEVGAFESGLTAGLFGTVPAVVGGAVLTLAVVALVAVGVPDLRDLDLDMAEPLDEPPDEVDQPPDDLGGAPRAPDGRSGPFDGRPEGTMAL